MSAPTLAAPHGAPGSAVDFQQQAMPLAPAIPPRPQASADAILSLYSAQMNRGRSAGNGMMSPPNNGMNGGGVVGYPTHMGAMPQPPMMMNRGPSQPMPTYGAGGYQQQGMMGAPPNPFQQQQMQQQQQMMMMQQQQQQQAMMMGQQGYPQQQQQQCQQPPPNPFRPQQQQQGNGMMGGMGMLGQPLQQQPNGGWPGSR